MGEHQITSDAENEIKCLRGWVLALWLLLIAYSAWAEEVLPTPLEESNYQALPDSRQITAFLEKLAAASSRARVMTYGHSAGGRPLSALLLSDDPQFLEQGLTDSNKLVVLLIGGQHGTEPSGTEALQTLARDVLQGPWQPWLKYLNLIFVPNSNPDGRDLHRRVNANGVNLSTDYVLLSQPETQALVKLIDRFQPHALLDVHESAVLKKKSLALQGYLTDFEAQFEFANHINIAPELRLFAQYRLLPEVLEAVNNQGLTAHRYIGEITSIDQPITHGGISLRNLRNYAGMVGVLAFLLENRLDPPGSWPTWRNIQVRVAKQRIGILAFLDTLIRRREEVLDRLKRCPKPTLLALRSWYALSSAQPRIAIGLRRIDSGEQVGKEFAYYGQVVAKDWVFLPRAYAVVAHQAQIARLLDRHGIQYRQVVKGEKRSGLCQKVAKVHVERWQQGVIQHRKVQVLLEPEACSIALGPDDLMIDLRQAKGPLAFLLLDPRSSTGIFQNEPYTSWLTVSQRFWGVPLH